MPSMSSTTTKIENQYQRSWKSSNIWRLNNLLLNNPWIKQVGAGGWKSQEKLGEKKHFEWKENENMTCETWGTAKAVLRGNL